MQTSLFDLFTVAGTGHRANKLPHRYGSDHILVEVICEALVELKATNVITGMALGFDTALAKAAIILGLPFAAYIPFKGQELMWPAATQRLYRDILKKAAVQLYCSDPGYAAYKMQKRNIRMVDDCDHLLQLWDGSPGGTYNCIKYNTEKAHKPSTNLWTPFQNKLHEAA